MATATAAPIRSDATVERLKGAHILRLPIAASKKLPSRGQVAVRARLNGTPFTTVVEPDGGGGHWVKLDDRLHRATKVADGDTVALELEVVDEWPEPTIPPDLASALAAAPHDIREMWDDITPMSRWEWVRWVNATRSPQTRQRRVEVTISKMEGGKRRPCCFNRAACTDPDLERSGRLIGTPPRGSA